MIESLWFQHLKVIAPLDHMKIHPPFLCIKYNPSIFWLNPKLVTKYKNHWKLSDVNGTLSKDSLIENTVSNFIHEKEKTL